MAKKSKIIEFLNGIEESLGVSRPKIIVLHFTDVEINAFVRNINIVEGLGYRFIHASEVAEFVSGARKINHPSVCLTFDSSNLEILHFALHFLETRQIKATVFLRSNCTESVLKEFTIRDNWELGSFGKTDADLSNKRAFFKKEIVESKQILERSTGKPVLTFAYPQGKYCLYARKNVKKAGYHGAFSLGNNVVSLFTSQTAIPRIEINSSSSESSQFDAVFRQWRRFLATFTIRNQSPINSGYKLAT